MRRGAVLAVTTLLALSCSQGSPPSTTHSPSQTASAVATTSGLSSPSASPNPTTSSFGLLLSAGTLELVGTKGAIAASATVAAPSVQFCQQGMGAVLQPPVSATSSLVYFRDGDTKIRSLSPDGHAADVTTVPGSATTISFFSVSPDDQSIAVLVEDLSPSTTANLRLYVEDLHGGGHHSDIYTTSTPKGKGGSTLWPMGWHEGLIVLAVVPDCTFEPAGLSPSAWHVVSASDAKRKADLTGSTCIMSLWPSAAGVACVDTSQPKAFVYDWTGKLLATLATQPNDHQSSISPAGQRILLATGTGIGAPAAATRLLTLGATTDVPVAGHVGCLWIDEMHVLAADAVIEYPSGVATALPASGVCVGRFPGAL
jgi:hypothetical protein